MAYAIDNALFQWEDGARLLRERPELEPGVAGVAAELRRRLGSTFSLAELADLYGRGVDWAWQIAERAGAGADAKAVVDTAFHRYARGAADYAGGRPRSA